MSSSLRFWLLILAVSAIGLALRLHFLAEPLWLDELHTAWSVDVPFSQIADRAGQGNQTPLFFWLTKCLTSIIGLTPLSLRLVSMICSCLAIPAAAFFVFHMTRNTMAAVVTGALVAVDHWGLFYATEARPYAMLELLALLQFWSFLWLLDSAKGSSRFCVTLILLTFALLATHLTGMLLLATEVILATCIRRNRMKILTSLLIGCLAAIPILVFGFSIFENRNQWNSDSGIVPMLQQWQNNLLFQLVPAACIFLVGGYKVSKTFDRGTILYLMSWAVVPLLLAALLHSFDIPLASYRYTTVAAIAFPVCVGIAMPLIGTKWLAIVISILVVGLNCAMNPVLQSTLHHRSIPSFRSEDWESAIHFVKNEFQEDSSKLLFLMPNLYEDSRALDADSATFNEYLKFPVSGIYVLPESIEVVPLPTRIANVWQGKPIEKLIRHGGALLICRTDGKRFAQIENEIRNAAIKSGHKIELKSFEQPGNVLKIAKIHVLINGLNDEPSSSDAIRDHE